VTISLKELAKKIGATLKGYTREVRIKGVAPLNSAREDQVSFLSNPKYAKEAAGSKAGAIILNADLPDIRRPKLISENPYLAWAKAVNLFAVDRTSHIEKGVHETAFVHPDAKIGLYVCVGPNAAIGANTVIGNNTLVHPGVVIEENCAIGNHVEIHPNAVVHYGSQVGNNCVIWSNAVIGSYGFGYAEDGNRFIKIHQLGCVVLEDDVEIGAGTTVDRGAIGDTIIKKGTKIDNLVQIAHNVEIGEHSGIAAQTGLSGSVKIGKRVKIAGQVGFVGHIEIGSDSFVGAKAGVSKSFPEKSNITGYPARNLMDVRRSDAVILKLPALLKRVQELENKIKEFEKEK
jgi:UDP-3-O-[3-hydroxymyristoyl] glucosamine N-acyltransferase